MEEIVLKRYGDGGRGEELIELLHCTPKECVELAEVARPMEDRWERQVALAFSAYQSGRRRRVGWLRRRRITRKRQRFLVELRRLDPEYGVDPMRVTPIFSIVAEYAWGAAVGSNLDVMVRIALETPMSDLMELIGVIHGNPSAVRVAELLLVSWDGELAQLSAAVLEVVEGMRVSG